MLIGFGTGLRWEKVPLIVLSDLLKFWDKTRDGVGPFIMTIIYRRLKCKMGFRWHCLPIVDRTRVGLPICLWIGRLVRCITFYLTISASVSLH